MHNKGIIFQDSLGSLNELDTSPVPAFETRGFSWHGREGNHEYTVIHAIDYQLISILLDAKLPKSAYPAAQAILPQFGSCPKMADLTREEDTTAFATFLAASLSAAPVAFTSIKHVAPSPSQAIDFAKPCMEALFFSAASKFRNQGSEVSMRLEQARIGESLDSVYNVLPLHTDLKNVTLNFTAC